MKALRSCIKHRIVNKKAFHLGSEPMFNRRYLKGRRPHNKKRKLHLRLLIFLSIFTFFGIYTYEYLNQQILPTLLAIAEMKVRTIATTVINEAVKNVIIENNINTDELVTYYFNEAGEVVSVGINTIQINALSAEIVEKITEDFDKLGIERIEVPFGNIIGSNVVANSGPNIGIEILPVGTTSISYDREFQSTGINQINHRVWLNINTTLQVVVPMATDKLTISQEFTLVDRVLSGVVPPNYIQVPKENALDVAPDYNYQP